MRNTIIETPGSKPSALLLLGPTGSGKTPLGKELERFGAGSYRCRHFDFGEQLRRISTMSVPEQPFTLEEVRLVRQVLNQGLLLEDDQFLIAEKILGNFLNREIPHQAPKTLVVLNGLPRHMGQARDVACWVDVRCVLHLQCDTETVLARIQRDIGQDRAGRVDDQRHAIQDRIDRFEKRTLPLLSFYKAQNAKIIPITITPSTTAQETRNQLISYLTI